MDSEDETITLERALMKLAGSLLGWVAIFGIATVIVRVGTNPDAGRTVAMWGARRGEQFAMRRAQTWANLAASCERVYDKARNGVSV